jgi:hypothetical protein
MLFQYIQYYTGKIAGTIIKSKSDLRFFDYNRGVFLNRVLTKGILTGGV